MIYIAKQNKSKLVTHPTYFYIKLVLRCDSFTNVPDSILLKNETSFSRKLFRNYISALWYPPKIKLYFQKKSNNKSSIYICM